MVQQDILQRLVANHMNQQAAQVLSDEVSRPRLVASKLMQFLDSEPTLPLLRIHEPPLLANFIAIKLEQYG